MFSEENDTLTRNLFCLVINEVFDILLGFFINKGVTAIDNKKFLRILY